MRVHVYKGEEEGLSVMVEPRVGRGLPPVLLQEMLPEDILSRLLPVIEKLRTPPKAAPG